MYPKYFGLKEHSFSITPDPQYLFLSGQHREALAHLLYGAGGGGGFVLLTGEVGTGKTTVCRAFLEQLPDGVDVALVVNPAMTATELLHAVCDEFRVKLPPGEPSVKTILDHLNRFLLDAHARGRRPVLIIDEAQNLRPKVLEQIRLLTNLETSKQKLLQIFLIGQPELRALLASPDLRQLNQRITARYHLTPLGPKETAAYVDHRIAVAGVDRPLFSRPALRRVHRRTRGVPRLINLLCDRALLGAAVSRRMQVTPGIVDTAAREVIDRTDPALPHRHNAVGIAAALAGTLVFGVWIGAADLPQRLPETWAASVPRDWLAMLDWPRSDNTLAETADSATDASVDHVATADASAGDGESSAPPSAAPAVVAQVDIDGGLADADADADSGDSADSIDMRGVEEGSAEGGEAYTAGSADLAALDDEVGADVRQVSEPASATGVDAADGSASAGVEAGLLASKTAEEPTDAPDVLPDELEPIPEARPPRIATARVTPKVDALPAEQLGDALVQESAVVDELLRLWEIELSPGARFLDCAAVPAFALACERSTGRWSDLRRFDRPVALKLRLPGKDPGFVVVGRLDEEHALLHQNGAAMRVPIAELDERWSGDYLLLWRPPPYGGRIIGERSSADAVGWLRERIALLPDSDLTVDPARYDADVLAAVRRFQTAQGLAADGIAGPRTLIVLSNVLADLDVPRLSHSR